MCCIIGFFLFKKTWDFWVKEFSIRLKRIYRKSYLALPLEYDWSLSRKLNQKLLQFGLKSIHFKKTVAPISILSKLWYFCYDLYWKYHNFERNEDCATVFLKWTDFILPAIQISNSNPQMFFLTILTNICIKLCNLMLTGWSKKRHLLYVRTDITYGTSPIIDYILKNGAKRFLNFFTIPIIFL